MASVKKTGRVLVLVAAQEQFALKRYQHGVAVSGIVFVSAAQMPCRQAQMMQCAPRLAEHVIDLEEIGVQQSELAIEFQSILADCGSAFGLAFFHIQCCQPGSRPSPVGGGARCHQAFKGPARVLIALGIQQIHSVAIGLGLREYRIGSIVQRRVDIAGLGHDHAGGLATGTRRHAESVAIANQLPGNADFLAQP